MLPRALNSAFLPQTIVTSSRLACQSFSIIDTSWSKKSSKEGLGGSAESNEPAESEGLPTYSFSTCRSASTPAQFTLLARKLSTNSRWVFKGPAVAPLPALFEIGLWASAIPVGT